MSWRFRAAWITYVRMCQELPAPAPARHNPRCNAWRAQGHGWPPALTVLPRPSVACSCGCGSGCEHPVLCGKLLRLCESGAMASERHVRAPARDSWASGRNERAEHRRPYSEPYRTAEAGRQLQKEGKRERLVFPEPDEAAKAILPPVVWTGESHATHIRRWHRASVIRVDGHSPRTEPCLYTCDTCQGPRLSTQSMQALAGRRRCRTSAWPTAWCRCRAGTTSMLRNLKLVTHRHRLTAMLSEHVSLTTGPAYLNVCNTSARSVVGLANYTEGSRKVEERRCRWGAYPTDGDMNIIPLVFAQLMASPHSAATSCKTLDAAINVRRSEKRRARRVCVCVCSISVSSCRSLCVCVWRGRGRGMTNVAMWVWQMRYPNHGVLTCGERCSAPMHDSWERCVVAYHGAAWYMLLPSTPHMMHYVLCEAHT
eukprot:366367-Chlamydomonas_euryale.AAC.14